jgi:hypothetical protein
LSDHADFYEHIDFVRAVNPKKVFTTHGFATEFAATLRSLGFEAQPLEKTGQKWYATKRIEGVNFTAFKIVMFHINFRFVIKKLLQR